MKHYVFERLFDTDSNNYFALENELVTSLINIDLYDFFVLQVRYYSD